MSPMKIVLAGATGFIGRKLIDALIADEHHIVILTRRPTKAALAFGHSVEAFQWDAHSPGDWFTAVDGADAVINLTGESLAAKRWSKAQKQLLRSSRIDATKVIVQAIEKASVRPSVLINASAVGYYGDVPEDIVTELYPASTDFLGTLSEDWEQEAHRADKLGVRVACVRIGIVLGDGGGALEKMVLPFKFFVGGPLGSGKQWFPWIHRDDVIGSIRFVLVNDSISGAVNLTAPNPVTMNDFCKTLGRVMGRPSIMRVPGFVLKLAVGEFAKYLLTGQKAVPDKLLNNKYQFFYSDLEKALRNILTK
ncbi:TIGR01777 family oxidoreductase [bacterium]|nr:TIGR01777 family oxidoreductase [bacterium]